MINNDWHIYTVFVAYQNGTWKHMDIEAISDDQAISAINYWKKMENMNGHEVMFTKFIAKA